MSFSTERSVVKNLGYIHVYASEILRFALNDKGVNFSLKLFLCSDGLHSCDSYHVIDVVD